MRDYEGPPILAFLDEYGDVETLVVKGERFNGPHAPISLLKDIKLKEIPRGVYIIPVEKIEGSVIYGINPSKFVWSDVYLYRDRAELEIIERAKYWEYEIGIIPFMEMLRKSLKAVGKSTKMIRRVHHHVDKDYHHIAFTVPLNPEMTFEQAMNLISQLFERVEEEMMERVAEFYETRLAAWRRLLRARKVRNAKRRWGI